MTTTEDDFTFIPKNYLPPKSIDDTHFENLFDAELETLPKEEKPAFLAQKQTVINHHLREIKQRANDCIQFIFAQAIIKQNILNNGKAITNMVQYKEYA
eukprot:1198927-Ditylum_brightwellii.AAC.1